MGKKEHLPHVKTQRLSIPLRVAEGEGREHSQAAKQTSDRFTFLFQRRAPAPRQSQRSLPIELTPATRQAKSAGGTAPESYQLASGGKKRKMEVANPHARDSQKIYGFACFCICVVFFNKQEIACHSLLLHYKGEGFTCDLSAREPLDDSMTQKPEWSRAEWRGAEQSMASSACH